LEPLAVAPSRETATRDEHEVDRFPIGGGEVAHPALGAAAPAVQYVQQDRPRVEARAGRARRARERGADTRAQGLEWRRRSGITWILALAWPVHGPGRGHAEMVEQDDAQAGGIECIALAHARGAERGEAAAVP